MLRLQMSRKFAPLLRRKARYKIMYGGRGGMRSWSCARSLLVKGASETIRVLCARELQNSIKDSVHRLLCDQIEELGIQGYEVTNSEIVHSITGSRFIFEGLRYNTTKIKSLEGIDICWVEEAERVSSRSWAILIPTIRKSGSEIWVTFNPDQADDPTWQRFIVNTPPGSWVLFVNSWDNPWLPKELRDERDWAYKTDPDAAANIWGGQLREATDAQILKGKWVVDRFEPEADWLGPYQGADWGFAQDPTTLIRMWESADLKKLFVEYEAWKIGLELDDTVRFWLNTIPPIRKKEKKGNLTIERDYTVADFVTRADPSRPETISHLRRKGMPHLIAAPSWQNSVEDGIAFLRSYEQIVIHERCKHTIDEAKNYSYAVDERTGDILREIVDEHNHCIDPMRYGLAPQIRKRKGRLTMPTRTVRQFHP